MSWFFTEKHEISWPTYMVYENGINELIGMGFIQKRRPDLGGSGF